MGNRSNISLVGNTTTGQNLGGGVSLFEGKNNGNNLQFKSLSAGTGMIITSTANAVTFCSTGEGGGGDITGGTNGLTKSGAKLILGGALTGNTFINVDNGYIHFTDTSVNNNTIITNTCIESFYGNATSYGDFIITATGPVLQNSCTSPEIWTADLALNNGCICMYSLNNTSGFAGNLHICPSGITVFGDSTNFKGIEYDQDYSLTFTDLSLVNKGWVLSQISGDTPGGKDIGWSNLINGSTIAGCGTVPSGATIIGNTFYGVCAGANICTGCTGCENVGIGLQALSTTSSGSHNIAVGMQALYSNSCGSDNVAVGFVTLQNNTCGLKNIAIGSHAVQNNDIGCSNIGIGYAALANNTCGADNVGIGCIVLNSNTTGSYNIGIGPYALTNNISGNDNVAFGVEALCGMKCGCSNIAIGCQSLYTNTGGTDNIAIGCCALNKNLSGYDNIAIGANALYNNLAQDNLAIGFQSHFGKPNGTGFQNISLGYRSLFCNNSGCVNFAVGFQALLNNTIGSNNIAIGCNASYCSTGGSNNIAIGQRTLICNTSGNNNTALGDYALCSNLSGSNNVAIGFEAGFNETGSSKLHISNCASCTLICGDFVNKSVKLDSCLAVVHMPNGATATQGLVWDTGSTMIKSVPIIDEWVGSIGELLFAGQKFAYPTQTIMQTDVSTCVTIPNYIQICNINLQNVGDTLIFTIPAGKTALLNRAKLIILNDASPTCFSVSIGNNCCGPNPNLSMNNLANLQQISDVLTNETYELDLSTRHQGVPQSCGSVVYFRVGSGSTSICNLCAHLLIEGFVY